MKGLNICAGERSRLAGRGDFCTIPLFYEKHANEMQSSMQTSPSTSKGTTLTHWGIGLQIPKSGHKERGPQCSYQQFPLALVRSTNLYLAPTMC